MSAEALHAHDHEHEVPDSVEDDDPAKTRRAAVESMVIHADGDSMWTVYSGTEAVGYTVFGFGGLSSWRCECPDYHYRRNECKHIRRVQMALGLRDIPEVPGRPDVKLMMDSRARVAAKRAARRAAVTETVSDTSESEPEPEVMTA